MASGNRMLRWLIKQLIQFVITIIVIAIFIATLYAIYIYLDVTYALVFFILFGAAYVAVVHNLISSFVDEVIMKN